MEGSKVKNKTIAKNTLLLYFRTFLVMLVTLYTSRVVLRALGETDYGIYNLIGGIVVFFAFMNTAMSAATQRYLNFHLGRGENDEVQRVFSMSVILHLIIIGFVLILGETIGLWFVKTQLNIPPSRATAALWVYQYSLITCCLSIIRIPYNAAIIAYEKMDFYAYLSIIEVVLKLAIVYLLIVSPIDVLTFYALLIMGVSFLILTLYKFYCAKNFKTTELQWFWDKSLLKKLMSFSGWSMFGSVANISVNQGLSIFFNLFYGVALNAALGLAHQIQAAMVSFISSFQTAFSPQIVKSFAAKENEAFRLLVFRTSRLSYCLSFLVAIPLIACISPILQMWLVEVPTYTDLFSVIYIVYCMVDALSGPLWISVQATGDIKKYQLCISILILLNLPLAYFVLFQGYSPVWALAIRAILNVVAYFYRIVYLSKHLSFPGMRYLKEVTLPVLLMTLLSLPVALYMSRFAVNMGYTLLICVILVMINLVLVGWIGLKKNERQWIFEYVKKKF